MPLNDISRSLDRTFLRIFEHSGKQEEEHADRLRRRLIATQTPEYIDRMLVKCRCGPRTFPIKHAIEVANLAPNARSWVASVIVWRVPAPNDYPIERRRQVMQNARRPCPIKKGSAFITIIVRGERDTAVGTVQQQRMPPVRRCILLTKQWANR